MATTHIRRNRPSFLFFQDANDLLVTEPAALHLVRPPMDRTLLQTGGILPRQVTNYMLETYIALCKLQSSGQLDDFEQIVLIHSGGQISLHDTQPKVAELYHNCYSNWLNRDQAQI